MTPTARMPTSGLALLRQSLQHTVIAGLADIEHVFATPRDDVERRLARIWADVLRRDHVAPSDDFFALGGHSLLAVDLVRRVEAEFGSAPPLARLFLSPTLGDYAAHVRGADQPRPVVHDDRAAIVTIKRGSAPTPLFMAPDLQGEIPVWFKLLATHMPEELAIYAVRSQGLAGAEAPHERMEEMVADYLPLIRQVQPHGPYMVAGHCFSGNVAFEIAHQLRAAGEEVAMLAIIDSNPFGHPPPATAVIDVRHLARTLSRGDVDRREYVRKRLGRIGTRTARFLGRRTGSQRLRERGRPAPYRGPRVAAANMRAASYYTCRPYPGHITIVTVNPPRTGARCWGKLAREGVDEHVIRGKGIDHVTVLREPHVRRLAAILTGAIRAAAPPPSPEPLARERVAALAQRA